MFSQLLLALAVFCVAVSGKAPTSKVRGMYSVRNSLLPSFVLQKLPLARDLTPD